MAKRLVYEKAKEGKNYDALYILLVLLGVVFELLFFYGKAPENFWKITLVDVVNILSQLATAGAFFLGFYQFRRGQHTERQTALVSECKAAVSRMSIEVGRLKTGNETSLENILLVAGRLGSVASDFDILFSSLDEGVAKAIVRMQWQSMYFDDFLPAFQDLELSGLVKLSDKPMENYITARREAEKIAHDTRVLPVFRKYFIFKNIMERLGMEACGMPTPLRELDVFQLNYYFFKSEINNDYLYGTLNRIDIRAAAPLIAALLEISSAWIEGEAVSTKA